MPPSATATACWPADAVAAAPPSPPRPAASLRVSHRTRGCSCARASCSWTRGEASAVLRPPNRANPHSPFPALPSPVQPLAAVLRLPCRCLTAASERLTPLQPCTPPPRAGEHAYAKVDGAHVWLDHYDSRAGSGGVDLCGGPTPERRVRIPVTATVPHHARCCALALQPQPLLHSSNETTPPPHTVVHYLMPPASLSRPIAPRTVPSTSASAARFSPRRVEPAVTPRGPWTMWRCTRDDAWAAGSVMCGGNPSKRARVGGLGREARIEQYTRHMRVQFG